MELKCKYAPDHETVKIPLKSLWRHYSTSRKTKKQTADQQHHSSLRGAGIWRLKKTSANKNKQL